MRVNVINNIWITSEQYGYAVTKEHEAMKEVIDKETKEVTLVPHVIGKPSYYSKLDHCLENIIERVIHESNPKDLKELLKEIKAIKKYLKEFSFDLSE